LSSVSHYHSSSRQEEEAKDVEPVKKGGLFGTGLSNMYALPIGLVAAVPAIKFEWYVVNEETQLLAVFIAFCVTFYTQAGGAIEKTLQESGDAILKEQQEAEEKVIEALEQKLEFLKVGSNMVSDFETTYKMREEAYANLNAAGKIKPHHDFKAQVERILSMISQEEFNLSEKAKTNLMNEATVAVTAQFETSKELKKAALDAAINKIKGVSKPGDDPVQAAFIQFFQDKGAAAAKADNTAEASAQRAALVAKLNALAANENFFFRFDETGQPKMVV
jgi:Mitochondrial ATP synthase B chain precursor (ATP-synt_B)